MADVTIGMRLAEWGIAHLVLSPKHGDLSLCKNLRGICVLDIALKIFSSMFVWRLQTVMEEEEMDKNSQVSGQTEELSLVFPKLV
jgi:hypothetical protein